MEDAEPCVGLLKVPESVFSVFCGPVVSSGGDVILRDAGKYRVVGDMLDVVAAEDKPVIRGITSAFFVIVCVFLDTEADIGVLAGELVISP